MSGRGSLRVQLSLLLDDENLYDGFIMPMKENKELNSFVIRLLSSYFYNEEVRALVDNSSAEDIQNEMEQDDSIAGMFSNAQQLLACMSAMEDIALNEFENGIESMTSMMDDVAEKTGGTRSSDSDFGRTAPQINTKFLSDNMSSKDKDNTQDNLNSSASDKSIENLIERYDRRFESIEELIRSIAIKVGVSDNSSSDFEENLSEIKDTQVPMSKNNLSEVFDELSDKEIKLKNSDEGYLDILSIPVQKESIDKTSEDNNKDVTYKERTSNSEENISSPDENISSESSLEENSSEEIIDGESTLQEFISNGMEFFG